MSQRILLVDDDPIMRLWARKVLEKAGYAFDDVANGQLAVDFLENTEVDLIIMDVRMPVMNGLDATRKIRQMQKFSKVPIIGLSADSNKELCLRSGMSDYLMKPASMSDIYDTLRHWLS